MPDENAIESTIYEIPEFRMQQLHKAIEKLNRRAEKLGCEQLSVKIHDVIVRTDPNYVSEGGNDADAPKVTYVQISIEGDAPKLAGYTFVGTLDHVVLPGSVVVKAVPGESVPQEFFEHDAYCDHCNKIRRRNQTFVLFKEDENKHVQVGRQCLRDFLGHDPSAIARYLSAVWKLIGEFEDEERWGFGGGGHYEYAYDHVRVLQYTSAVIRNGGWVPRSSANPEEDRPATADRVSFLMTPKYSSQERRARDAYFETLGMNDEDRSEAEAAIEWLKDQPKDNEYMHNLHAIADANAVPLSMFGFWCSLVAAYQRAQERLRLNKAQRKLNEYVGEVKERREFTVKIMSRRFFDSAFGTTTFYNMLDEEGHTLVWFSTSDPCMSSGNKYRIKGTVKKHEEYKDWKQTTLSRVKKIEEIAEEG